MARLVGVETACVGTTTRWPGVAALAGATACESAPLAPGATVVVAAPVADPVERVAGFDAGGLEDRPATATASLRIERLTGTVCATGWTTGAIACATGATACATGCVTGATAFATGATACVTGRVTGATASATGATA